MDESIYGFRLVQSQKGSSPQIDWLLVTWRTVDAGKEMLVREKNRHESGTWQKRPNIAEQIEFSLGMLIFPSPKKKVVEVR